jgi:hypothetical protein
MDLAKALIVVIVHSTTDQGSSFMKKCTVCGGARFSSYSYSNHLNKTNARYFAHFLVTIVLSPIKTAFPQLLKSFPLLNELGLKTIFSTFPTHKVIVCNGCGYGVYNKKLDHELVSEYYKVAYWQAGGLGAHKYSDDWQPDGVVEDKYRNEAFFLNDPRAKGQYTFVKEHLDAIPKIDMLEIGAASALISRLIRKFHKGDVSLDVIEPGEGWPPYYKLNNINLVGTYFPVDNGKKYNYIHGSGWLEHVVDVEDVVFCLNKLLLPGGLLFIEVPNCNPPYYSTESGDSPHVHFFTENSLVMLFRKFGFKVIKINEYGLTWGEDIKRRKKPDSCTEIVDNAKNSEVYNIPREWGQHCRALFKKIAHAQCIDEPRAV